MTFPPPPELRCGFAFSSIARTHVGAAHEVNEDRYLERTDLGLWAVADGMGGHEGGDVAATLVVTTLSRLVDAGSAFANLQTLRAGLDRVNAALAGKDEASVVGSTVVALLAQEGHYACIWAGDSRAYLLRGGLLRQITRDHSLVQELVEAGALTREEALRHPRANVITRAVGAKTELELDSKYAAIEAGDLFLLCSDGLTGVLEEGEIAELLSAAGLGAADALMGLAQRRLARDDVTLVLVRADAA
jgi:serine/threonine protein phosphatase PrpC